MLRENLNLVADVGGRWDDARAHVERALQSAPEQVLPCRRRPAVAAVASEQVRQTGGLRRDEVDREGRLDSASIHVGESGFSGQANPPLTPRPGNRS